MIFAEHALSGVVAGTYISNPILAFLTGVVLHFVLDAVPHYEIIDFKPGKKEAKWTVRQTVFVALNFVVGFLLLGWLFRDTGMTQPQIWGLVGGIFPDLLDNNPLWQRGFRKTAIGKKIHWFHDAVHLETQPSPWIGIPTGIVVIIISVWILVKS